MCGIVGIVEIGGRPVDRHWLAAMNGVLRHRGPDQDGFYWKGSVGLAMRRLSIIDVKGGRQPIHNENQTVWSVFNGEIYNYRELRVSLEQAGHRFYTQSDTETLVHLYEEYGEEGVTRLRGMFAYAIWDAKRRRLILARDRIGIKPLYYTNIGGTFVFASELKAFFRIPSFRREINPAAVQQYLRYLYIPGPETIFQGTLELPPAHYLIYEDGHASLYRYWDIQYTGSREFSLGEWQERFLAQFRDSVRSHLISEVPLGAFLSGGIDSSAIVGAMAQELNTPVETFSVGYEGAGAFQDERKYARLVATRFDTHHHEFVVSPDIQDLLPKLVSCFDQPFADSSAIPNYYISELTRRHVTVALSGLGGDEIGGGYERYLGMLWAEYYRRLPKAWREHLVEGWVSRLPDISSGRVWMTRLKRFIASAELAAPDRYVSYVTTFSGNEQRHLLMRDFVNGSTPEASAQLVTQVWSSQDADTLSHHLMLADLRSYLPGDLLPLSDRVSMAHSLEIRVPFLDHPLVELMARIPAELKISKWTKKILFKRAFTGLLPKTILERKKVGFSVPLALWLRTDLKAMMREILSANEIKNIAYLNGVAVNKLIEEHIAERANHENKLWALMNLVAWHRTWNRAPAIVESAFHVP
jgi:asparagine synthase (glutamine-hydrolysing)